jgi:hypothetical protein
MLERAVIMVAVFEAAWTFEYLLCSGALGNFVPNQTTAANRPWLSRTLVTPVFAAENTCSEQAFWSGMLAFALELLGLIWPFFSENIFGPSSFGGSEPPPGWKLGDPPNWEPKPAGAPPAPEPDCAPSPAAESIPPQPAAPAQPGAPSPESGNPPPVPEEGFYGGDGDKLIPRPASDSAVQQGVKRAQWERSQAENAYDEALAAQQQTKATAAESESEMLAANNKADELKSQGASDEERVKAEEEFLDKNRKYRSDADAADDAQSKLRRSETELKQAENREAWWRRMEETNGAARAAGEELNAANDKFGEYLNNGGRFEGPEYDAWRSAIARYDQAYKKFVDALRGVKPPVNAGGANGTDPTIPEVAAPGGKQIVNAGDGANGGDPTIANVPPATPPGSPGGSARGCGSGGSPVAKTAAGAANANAVGAPQ